MSIFGPETKLLRQLSTGATPRATRHGEPVGEQHLRQATPGARRRVRVTAARRTFRS